MDTSDLPMREGPSAPRSSKKMKRLPDGDGPHPPPDPPDRPAFPRTRQQAMWRLVRIAAASILLGAACAWGWWGQSIREDPFTSDPGWWQSFAKPQPHPALATIPVLPMGAAGILSWRPASTAWIIGRPAPSTRNRQVAASGFVIGSALAETPAAQQRQAPAPQTGAPSFKQRTAPAIQAAQTKEGSSEQRTPDKAAPIKREQRTPPADQAAASKEGSSGNQDAPSSKAGSPRAGPSPAPPDGKLTVAFAPAWSTTAGLENVPDRRPLDPAATNALLWAACDPAGQACLRHLSGQDVELSRDGGRTWVAARGERGQSLVAANVLGTAANVERSQPGPAPTIVFDRAGRIWASPLNLDVNRLFMSLPGDDQPLLDDPREAVRKAAASLLLPVRAVQYRINDNVDEYRPNAPLERAIWTEFLRGLSAAEKASVDQEKKSNLAALLADRDKAMAIALFDNGTILQSSFTLPDDKAVEPGKDRMVRLEHQPRVMKLDTTANLRSLYMQPDLRFGWISSGWNDGNAESGYPAIFQTVDGGATWKRLSYRRLPPPWALVLAMPTFFAFVASGIAFSDFLRAKEAEKGIEGAGSADAPIRWEDRDILDLKPLALALSRFVRNSDTAPPMTLAVTGPWGTGKSSLMNLIKEDLEWRGARPVWFNAWHHQKEEHILAALLENIRAQAIPPVWTLSGLVYRMRLVALRVRAEPTPYLIAAAVVVALWFFVDAQGIAAKLRSWIEAIVGLFSSTDATATDKSDQATSIVNGIVKLFGFETWTAAILLLLIRLSTSLKLNPAELMATFRRNPKEADLTAQLSFRHKFAKEFDAVGRALRSRSNPGLVIFIDDLDRCKTANLMEVLEAINFLATAGPCFIFLGMDEPKVVEIVAKEFVGEKSDPGPADHDRARQYIKKLINVTVPIPDMAEASAVQLLFGKEDGKALESPWPRRVRRFLRAAPDGAVPATILLVLVVFTASWLSSLPSRGPVARQEQARSPVSQQLDPSAGGATTGPAAGTQSPPDRFLARPTVTLDKLLAPPPLTVSALVALTLVLALLLMARRATVVPEDQVSDSDPFREALEIWHRVIFRADPTPRGVKRQQNRLRLYAMRLRSESEERNFLDDIWAADRLEVPLVARIFSALFGPPREGAALSAPTAKMEEPILVALGAIEALYGYIPDWVLTAPTQPPAKPAAHHAPHARTQAAKEAADDKLTAECLRNFRARFGKDSSDPWPPTADDLQRFRACGRAVGG